MIFGYSPIELLLLVVSILIAMTVHEAAHAYIGFRLGDTTAAEEGRVSLNPLRHIDPLMTLVLPVLSLAIFHAPVLAARPVPFNPERVRFNEFGAALIALAGPISNLAMAILAAILLRMLPASGLLVEALFIFITMNVSLFVFNLIPIPPLDGSRVLYAFAPEAVQQFMRSLEQFGLVLVFALVLVGGFSDALVRVNDFVLGLLL